jgi:predicted esterase
MVSEKTTEQSIKLYYDLYTPDSLDDGKPRPLVIGLHGYEGAKESMMAVLRGINSTDFVLASLQAPNSFFIREGSTEENPRIGFGWMMRYKAEDTIDLHHRTLLSIINSVSGERPVDRQAIFLIAFSQSVALNYRFTFTHPGLIRGVVAVCGGVPGDWEDDKYQKSDTDVLIIAAEQDQYYPIERARTFKDMIARRARSVDFYSFKTAHIFPRESLPVINEWLLDRLQPLPPLED